MNREITTLSDLAFYNLLDAIHLISNTGGSVNQTILSIYERNAAVFQNINQDGLIEHLEVNNIEE